jgi:hypothetical protein
MSTNNPSYMDSANLFLAGLAMADKTEEILEMHLFEI